MKNVQIRYERANASQVTEAAKQAISKNASSSGIIRPLLTGTLHPSTSRTEIDLIDILSMREKILYLDYPLMNFEQNSNIQYAQTSDLNSILEQYFTSTLEDNASARVMTDIAMKLVQVYDKKTKTSHHEALEIIDRWKPKK